MKKLLTLLTLILIFSTAPPAYAESIAYKLVDAFNTPYYAGGNNVAKIQNSIVTFNGGRMVISGSVDGTLQARVGDILTVSITKVGTYSKRIFTHTSYINNCKGRVDLLPTDITDHFFGPGDYYVEFKVRSHCLGSKPVDDVYITNFLPAPEITPIPTPTIDTSRAFMDLPWDYQSKGLTFTQAMLSMTAAFDHTYPLLNSSVPEPLDVQNQITLYDGTVTSQIPYSRHDGYDFARAGKALYGDSVLSAGAGIAEYVSSCKPCGNMILIDHENGYQTRYMHLQKDGLIVSEPNTKVPVTARQVIGKIGYSGNVIPDGKGGSHIHFMVVHDKDGDGNFSNNIPDGVVDPLGWQGEGSDPWEVYSFSHNNVAKQGAKSHYLFTNLLEQQQAIVDTQPEEIELSNFTFSFPQQVASKPLAMQFTPVPTSTFEIQLITLGHAIKAIAKDVQGNIVSFFDKAFTLSVDISGFDLSQISNGTLSIYSSEDGKVWKKEDTIIDETTGTATAEIDHFTYFVIAGDEAELVAPETEVNLIGQTSNGIYFKSAITFSLNASIDDATSNIDHTMYSINDEEWLEYVSPVTISDEGTHTIRWFSVSSTGAIEEVKSQELTIDITAPEIAIEYNPSTKRVEISPIEEDSVMVVIPHPKRKLRQIAQITDTAGNVTEVEFREYDTPIRKAIRIFSISNNGTKIIEKPLTVSNKDVYNEKKNAPQLLRTIQRVNFAKEKTVRYIYVHKTNTTEIITTLADKTRTSEKVEGKFTVRVVTEHGTIVYSNTL